MNKINISVEESKRITSLRFILILLILFIHNSISVVEKNGVEIPLIVPEYVRIIRYFISEIIAVSAVPLFTLISAYLLYAKNDLYKVVLKKKTRSILIPFILWTIISVVYFYIIQSFSDQYYQSPHIYVRNFKLIDWIDIFIGFFTDRAPFPMVMQMWFLRDLFILIIFHPIIRKIIDLFPISTFIILFTVWFADFEHTNISHEVILFFALGYYAVKYRYTINLFDKIKWTDFMLVFMLTTIFELFLFDFLPVIHKINILIGTVLFLKLSKFLISNSKLYAKLEWLGAYSFFVYAAHEPTLNAISSVWYRIFPMYNGYILVEYFGAIIITLILIIPIAVLLKKRVSPLYNILSGNR